MKREVEREQRLPAYSLTLAQLEALIERLRALFPKPEEVRLSVDIKLRSEKLTFESIDELRAYSQLKGNVTRFSVWLSGSSHRIWMSTGDMFFNSRTKAYVCGENEAWCAGAIETVQSFIQTRKLWYHWFVAAPVGWALAAVAYLPMLYFMSLPEGVLIDKAIVAGWAGAILALFLLWFGKGRFLPASILRVTEEDGLLRRRAPEFTLVIALVSAMLALVGLFVGK